MFTREMESISGLQFKLPFHKWRISRGHSQSCTHGNISEAVQDGVVVTTDH